MWLHKHSHCISLKDFEGIPMIFSIKNRITSLNNLVQEEANVIVESFEKSSLPPGVKQFLEDCQVPLLCADGLRSNDLFELCSQKYVMKPNSQGVLVCLINHYKLTKCDMFSCISKAPMDVRKYIKTGLEKHIESFTEISESTKMFLKQLEVFEVLNQPNVFASVQGACVVDKRYFSMLMSCLGHFVDSATISKSLFSKLNIKELSFDDIVEMVMKKIDTFSTDNQHHLYEFLLGCLEKFKLREDVLNQLKKHLQVASDGKWLMPCHLFERTSDLEKLFYSEPNRFPDKKYNTSILKKLDLKLQSDIALNDIAQSIKSVAVSGFNEEEFLNIVNKVKIIMQTVVSKRFNINEYFKYNWIPVKQKYLGYYYPLSLAWFGANHYLSECSHVYLPSQELLVGSAANIIHPTLSDAYASFPLCKDPPLHLIIQHLKNIEKSYNDEEKGLYKQIIKNVYNNLCKYNVDDVAHYFKTHALKVWQGSFFLDIHKVLCKNLPVQHNVAPYYHQIKTTEIPDAMEKVLITLDASPKKEIDVYLSVLEQIKEKQKGTETDNHSDLQLSLNLVRYIAKNFASLPSGSQVYVPIQSKRLNLQLLSTCYYKSIDTDDSNDTTRSYNLLHEDLSEEDAEMLKVPNLVSKLLSSGTPVIFQSWGQQEPLTTKLNRILKDYNDGFAIAKEFVQNADDAGAKVVKFLYDKRQNNSLKSGLFDNDMKFWQGPALWVYNSAEFSEEDFKNITKLNAGTKELDSSKIGTFGLGFNSVYNLTDVPSILSGNTLIVFDPHTEYLGRALTDKTNPGVRISLNGESDLTPFSNQFKVFDGIFGCHLDLVNGDVQPFSGTLFRLPLRNSETAPRSKISKLVYSDIEMKLLFKKVEEKLEHLLLFTENVSEVVLNELSDDTNEMSVLSSVRRDIQVLHRKGVENEVSVMKLGTKMLQGNLNFVNVDIQLKVTVDSFVNNKSGHRTFLVSSCVGGEKSYEYARTHQGCNPCGSAAVEINDQSENVFVENADGDLFCFLPLPIKSGFPVHVNGFFSLSSDRKHLLKSTQDDKTFGLSRDWNDILADDLSTAYINLLLQLKRLNSNYSLIKWSKIFPLTATNNAMKSLVKSFVRKLLETDDEPFPSEVDRQWVSWKKLRFLSEEFSPLIKLEVLAFLNWHNSKVQNGLFTIDLPLSFQTLFTENGFKNELSKSTISQNEFIKLFLNNFSSPQLDVDLRNKITIHLIKNNIDVLYNYPCLPTKSKGKLKMSSECVVENSKVAVLFGVDDEVFVIEQFKPFLYNFKDINHHHLSWKMILVCARSISRMAQLGYEKAVERSSSLLKLMESTDISECAEDIKNELLDTKFLPSQPRPDLWPFHAHCGDSIKIEAPNKCFAKQYLSLASVTKPVCKFRIDKTLLKFLGLVELPPFEIVKQQLVDLNLESKPIIVDEKLQSVLHEIYDYLSKSSLSTKLSELHQMRLVYSVNFELVIPKLIYINFLQDISPYMFQLSKCIASNEERMKLMINLGVKEVPSHADILNVLSRMQNDYSSKPITHELLKSILYYILPFLLQFEALNKSAEVVLYLPDIKGVLRRSTDLYFKDTVWLQEEAGINYCHSDIPPSHCIALGVLPDRNKFLISRSKGIPYKPFGQHEKLTVRIKNLLKGYRNDEDILNELLQNADDAGAAEVIFILDTRCHGGEKVFSDEWKDLQGPALLVCNDAPFKVSDLEGIQLLGQGTKSTNALQTGKYGVGFNAVYQITDCPMLLASIAEGGDVLCVFDPNLKYVATATEDKPGVMIENARKTIEPFTDLKDALLIDEFDSNGKTLFRFPLRNEMMAKLSHLSSKVVNADEIEKMFKKFEKHFSSILLFLKHVTKLTLKTIADGVESVLTVTVQPYDTSLKKIKNFQISEHHLADKLGNVTALMNFEERLNKFVCVKCFSNSILKQTYHWNIIEQVGFSGMDKVSPKITELIEKNELFLLPKGGVAIKMKKKCEACQNKEIYNFEMKFEILTCTVFCSLPLPMSLPLPIIINGNFVLEYETRRSLSLSSTNSVEVIWNETIIQSCIVPCYLDYLISYATKLSKWIKNVDKHKSKIKRYYDKFPQNLEENIYGPVIKKSFFQAISKGDYQVLLVLNENPDQLKVDKFSSNNFLVYEVMEKTAQQIKPPLLLMLQRLFIPCDFLPDHIKQSFDESEVPLKECSPDIVREKLCELTYKILPKHSLHWDVKKTVFLKKKNVIMVLKYCLSEAKRKQQERTEITESNVSTIELKDLPLCLCADGGVTRFSEDNQKFFSEHSDLFRKMADKFLDKDIVSEFSNYKSSKYFKDFNVCAFVEFLPTVLPKKQLEGAILNGSLDKDKIICVDHAFTLKWYKKLWTFLAECNNKKKENWLHEDVRQFSMLVANSAGNHFILPVEKSKQVLLLNGIHSSLDELSKTLQERFCVFVSVFVQIQTSKSEFEEPKKYIYTFELAIKLFGSIENPSDLINALSLSFNNNMWKDIRKEEAKIVLKYFQHSIKNIQSDVKDSLKALPLFLTIDDNLVCLKSENVVLVTDEVIFDGLSDFLKDNVFLKFIDEGIELLYKSLGSSSIGMLQFYQSYVFPNFDLIDDDSIDKHIGFITRSIEFKLNPDQWIGLLKFVKFVKTHGGGRSICSELYDPTNDLFTNMLPKEKFPNLKICDESWRDNENKDWLNFLKDIGLVTQLNNDLFIMFAREIEKSENLLFFQNISKQLLFYMSELWNEDLYEKIKKIKFISPPEIDGTKESIYQSVNSTCQKICLEGSASSEFSDLIWTSMPVLPNLSMFCNFRNLDVGMVVEHMRNVTNSKILSPKSKTSRIIPSNLLKTFENIFKKLYEYFKKNNNLIIIQQLQEMSVVLVLKNSCLEIPTRASLFEERSISPYLNTVDVSLGQFFDFLEKIGCHRQPSSSAYVQVLKSLADDTKGNVLHPNDVKIASSAMLYLSEMLLKNSLLSTNVTLYLPTYSFSNTEKNSIHLTLSSNIIAMTDYCLAERLKGFQEPILFNDQNQLGTSDVLMKYLPVEIRPKNIGEVIEEVLICEINPINVPSNHISKDINQRLKAPEFLSALQRMVQHEFMSRATDVDVKDKMEKMKKDLQHVNVIVLPQITTKLKFLPKNTLIEDSNGTCNVFLCKSEKGVNLYLSSSLKKTDLSKICVYLAEAIMEHLNLTFKDTKLINVFQLLFHTPLEILSSTLDEFKIYRDSLNVPFLNHGQLPLPGDKVPLEFYPLLSNKYFDFTIDDYAALDVGNGDEREFIYVIIKGKPDGVCTDLNSLYTIQEGPEEVLTERKSFELYGFNSNAKSCMRDSAEGLVLMSSLTGEEGDLDKLEEVIDKLEEDIGEVEEICSQILEELKKCISFSSDEKKKVIRRLCLRWHPDKHSSKNKEKATKIFQFLQMNVKKMEEGIFSHFGKWTSQASQDRKDYEKYFKRFFKSEYNRRGTSNSGHQRRSDFGSWVPPSFEEKNPQPGEAKRWLRQAMFDLESAEKDCTFEWKCFKSHQV